MTKAAELAKMGEVLTNSQIGGRRNIVINGAMQVAQRATSVTGIGSADGYFTLDRFAINVGSTSAGRLTMSQATVTDLPGFANALKLECTTADTSIAAGEQLTIDHKIEGQDLQQFKKGTSQAESFTISFYVKANANATYACELFDSDNTRQITKLFNVTNSWSRIILTFPPDTSGVLDDDNASSMNLIIALHGGSTYTSGTLNTSSWADNVTANRRAGITSFFDSTDRTFFITGLQLEVGSQATPFEHRSFGEELRLCKRYFETLPSDGKVFFGLNSNSSFSAYSNANVIFKVEKRANPTITASTSGNSGNAISSYSTVDISTWGFIGSGNAQASDAFFLNAFTADSEL